MRIKEEARGEQDEKRGQLTQRALEQQTNQKTVLYECKEWDVENGPQVMLNGSKALHVKRGGGTQNLFFVNGCGRVLRLM